MEVKIYRPDIAKKISLRLIDYQNPNLFQPWKGLDFFYLKQGNNYLHIPSNTQLSEFLNKFNESQILPKLGEYKLNEINFGRSKMINPQIIKESFGWDWIHWSSQKGQDVFEKLSAIFEGKKFLITELNRATLMILGRLKLKESIDYGKQVESDFNHLLETSLSEEYNQGENLSIESKEILKKLQENDYVVIAYKQKFVHPQGIFWGEIDYILMNTKTKKIHIADLKTSSNADIYDYWRQLAIYYANFLQLNPHLKKHLSEQLVIIHVNNLKERLISKLYHHNINDDQLLLFAKEAINFKMKYIDALTKWKD